MQKIHFEKAGLKHKDTIFRWLAEPHIQEFWDNSQAHKDDIVNFMNGRQEPSDYAHGRYVYWIGLIDNIPFCFLMTIKENQGEEREAVKDKHLSKTGSTYSIDFMIGEKDYFGKGLGARTLKAFIAFFQQSFDHNADTFFIDPDVMNPRAKHVYEQAGFIHVGNFVMGGKGVFKGRETHFLVKKIPLNPILVSATLNEYPVIQNMARFYVYELSRYCGFISDEWACPLDGLYTDVDLKQYFQDQSRRAYLIKIGDELAGFALLHHVKSATQNYWVLSEFFILAKYQGQGIGRQVAEKLCKMFPGKWEVPIIPENTKALNFWRNAISSFMKGHYQEEKKAVDYDKYQPKRHILSFDTKELEFTAGTSFTPEKVTSHPLDELIYLEKDASAFGFEWPNKTMIIEQAIDECQEIRDAIENQESPDRLQEEIGDLIHSAISLCLFAGFDVTETIDKVNHKFGKRMQAIKMLTHQLGLENLRGQSFEFMLELWHKAKMGTK